MTDNMIDLNPFEEDFEINPTIDRSVLGDIDPQGDVIQPGIHESILDDDGLDVPYDDIDQLEERASDIERSYQKDNISFEGRIPCSSRHGCQGATECNYSYGDYPG